MAATDVHGPIDFVLIEFPGDNLTAAVGETLAELVERGLVRIYDLTVISKGEDGSLQSLEIGDYGGDGFGYFSGVGSGLLGDDDARAAAAAMEPGTVAALILYENTWAIPFVAAVRGGGGDLIASARIPAEDVIDALDELETTS